MHEPLTFQKRWRERASSELILINCHLRGKDRLSRWIVFIKGKYIDRIVAQTVELFNELKQKPTAVDCGGYFVMPGLCDAHVHVTAHTADLSAMMAVPESLTTARAANILRGMLMRGFTTVRDCGGADWGLAEAVEEGTIPGPRLLFTGHALSQTGGHGDMRCKGDDCFACGAALRSIGRVCDGTTEVRKAARDELRKGAHCIKVMASGGVSSPTDRLTSTQFSLEELKAIVEEAKATGTYVCAHAYTAEAIRRAVECGVRSIEHGNYLDAATAEVMAAAGTYLVPTLATYQALRDAGESAGMKPELVAKVGNLVEAGLVSLRVAKSKGVKMCFGTDLLGDLHEWQLSELALRASVLPSADVIAAATVNCAELFGMQDSIAKLEPGYLADIIVCGCDPYYDAGNVARDEPYSVIKEGVIMKQAFPMPSSKVEKMSL